MVVFHREVAYLLVCELRVKFFKVVMANSTFVIRIIRYSGSIFSYETPQSPYTFHRTGNCQYGIVISVSDFLAEKSL